MTNTMAYRYLLHAPGDLRKEPFELGKLAPTDLHLRSLVGAISSGTESAWYFGTDPQLADGYRAARFPRPSFPRFLGYEKVAEVVAVGSAVTDFRPGQRVITNYGHADEHIWPASEAAVIPDQINDDDAVFATLMNVASHGVRRSNLRLGDAVLITGMGVVGIATLICARLAGAGWIAVSDRHPHRLGLARRFGADATLNTSEVDVPDAIAELVGPQNVDVAFECSSSYEALVDGMAATKRNGTVCVVAQLKGAYPQHPTFGVDFHLGELNMVSADGTWDLRSFSRWFFGAIERGAIQGLGSLISERVPFDRLESGFELLHSRPDEILKLAVTY